MKELSFAASLLRIQIVECYSVSLGEQFPSFEEQLDIEVEGTVIL
jgi:hypothetical protein